MLSILALLSPLLIGAQNPLVMVKPGQDLSAYRFDCDVFGWNRDFSEVAGVGSEVTRGPQGKHRGEAFMLAYKVGETTPIYNVIVHNITHADFPNDPVPMDDARGLMWTIENSYLGMWPKRPVRKHVKGAMTVEPMWDPMENDRSGDCTPGVAFLLEYRGQKRMQPYQSVDMQANCSLLNMSDWRVYWGKKDLAAAMVRFDFSPRPENEESARFVVSASWNLAQSVRISVDLAGPLTTPARGEINTTLRAYGTVAFHQLESETQTTAQLNRIQAKTAWLPLAHRLTRELHAPLAEVRPDDSLPFDLVLRYGVAPAPPAVAAPPVADANSTHKNIMTGRPKTRTAPVRDGDPILPAEDDPNTPASVEDPTLKPMERKVAAPRSDPSYVKDWQVH